MEKFFSSDAVANKANAIVREGIQNSLDAAPDSEVVRVRIAVGAWPAPDAASRLVPYFVGFKDHFESVKAKLPSPPAAAEPFRYLAFEDFGTSGLCGDPEQWWLEEEGVSNPFFNYFRSEGLSDKSEGARGRHGVGRLVFMFASRARSVFALTRRDGETLLMGTSVLRNHRVGPTPFLPDAWFGVPSDTVQGLTLPISEQTEFLQTFSAAFGLKRGSENGLSVVVPWLTNDVTEAAIIKSVVQEFFHPILRKKLVVEVIGESGEQTMIDDATISLVAVAQGTEFYDSVSPALDLARTSLTLETMVSIQQPESGLKWADQELDDQTRPQIQSALAANQVVWLRVHMQVRPKLGDHAGEVLPCFFDVFLRRDLDAREGQVLFIREGIIISDARHTSNRQLRCPGARALVVIDHAHLAKFLGDCENPSHTEWQHAYVKETYFLAKQHLEYVAGATPAILRLASENAAEPDETLLLDLFSVASRQPDDPARQKTNKNNKKGTATKKPDVDVNNRRRRLTLSQTRHGFVIGPGVSDAPQPETIELLVAYDVRRGSPFKKYHKADFRLFKGKVKHELTGCQLISADENWATFRVLANDFEIRVSGFDSERDLKVALTARDGEVEHG